MRSSIDQGDKKAYSQSPQTGAHDTYEVLAITLSDNEPFFEATVAPVREKRSFSFSDTSDSSGEAEKKITEGGKIANSFHMKAMFHGAQTLLRPNACKLVEDGSECYVAYRDFGLY